MCVLYINLYSFENMSKYVPQFPYRKQSVFVAPQGLNSIVDSPPPLLLQQQSVQQTQHTVIPQRTQLSPPQHSSSSAKKSNSFALPKANVQILDQRINKIISENAAIVETWDPLWSKKYIRDSRNVSTPSMTHHVSHHNGVTSPVSAEMSVTHDTPRRYSEQPLSKLQSALLGKASAASALTSQAISISQTNNRKYSDSLNDSSPQAQSVIINAKDKNGERIDSIVRNLLTAKTPAIHVTPSEKTIPVTSVGAHPQNPEGSIIKDLLLKSRDEIRRQKSSRADMQGSSSGGEQESSMLVYVCTVCNIAFRNKENLEVHQIHYCKGNNDLVSPDKTLRHKMDDYVQRKVSVMARPISHKHMYRNQAFSYHHSHHSHPKHVNQSESHQQQLSQLPLHAHHHSSSLQQQSQSHPLTPVGNILKQQLLAPNQASPLKKRKISEPVFRTICDSADVQIIDETPMRRISVVQQTITTATSATMISPSTTFSTTKSAPQSQQLSHFHHQSLRHSYPPYPSYSSVSSSHIVIQPVLNSGGTVIENLSQSSKSSNGIQVGVDYVNVNHISNHNRNSQTTATTLTVSSSQSSSQPVNKKCGPNLVSMGIDIIPEYNNVLNKPKTKITLKAPIMFPVLESLYANSSNTEFIIDDCGSYKLCESFERPFKQVASVPQLFNDDNNNYNNDSNSNININSNNNNSSNSNIINNEDDDEIQIVSQNSGKEQHETDSSSSKLLGRTTGAIRPRTLSLRANASTLISSTLISPDTPRPKKSHVQQYINGHAYTYIGLKVTTRPTYCCIYRAQPMFITQKENPGLSMYSNWKAIPLPPNDILHLAPPKKILGLYDSGLKSRVDSMINTCSTKCDLNLTHSSYWQFRKSDEERDNLRDIMKLREDIGEMNGFVFRKTSEESTLSGETDSDGGEVGPPKRVRIFEGGFKSNEDYTYVRGRGRGKYVCEECGIRCKKPSMLKKHIRTHTDLRPYSCRHCAFAFKTKGNLTKHMKSKAHHKKCVEMGIIPVPITIDDSQIDSDALAKQEMLEISCGGLPEDDDDDDDEGEYDDDDDEDDDEGVPIPLIELRRYETAANHVNVVPGQFEDAEFSAGDRNRNISETESIATESEEQEAARSLLILSGSGSESDLTALSSNTRKSSTLSSNLDDIRNSPVEVISRKVSVIDRRVDGEQHRRISQQHLDHNNIVKVTDISEIISPNVTPMHPPLDNVTLAPPPPPLMSSPRKLSPIEHLQQHVQEQQKQMMQTTWTPNCDSLSRQRSYSFNDLPINANVFPSTSSRPIAAIPETITSETITDESSDDSSLDSFASRRYSTSVITERRWNSQTNAPLIRTVITEREEPMDLSLNPKGNELMDIIPHLNRMKSNPMRLSGLRQGEFIPTAPQRVPTDSLDGKSICSICNKQFSKPSQLRLHINIHYFERPFRCDSCAVSFRTKGHLQKHKRSVSHFNKVNMNMTFGTPTTDNPRPFKCADCKIAFRIHGHLAKHLRSKMHIMKLECLGKLPFGMYAEMERSGVNLNEIDTTDCENSLQSLQVMAHRLYDPRQMRWASEPIIENNGDDNGVIVKMEPNDAYYPLEHPLEHEIHEQNSMSMEQIEPSSPQLRSPSHQSVISPPAQCLELPLSPQSQPTPQSRKSPVMSVMSASISAQQQAHHQQSTGFTSTRSNTCHLCGRIFKDAKFLQVHLYTDHKLESEASQMDDRPEYECDICHKFFSEYSHLQQHLVSHSVSRPYVCEICDAGFTSSLLLASHCSTHHQLTTQPIL